MSGEGKVPAASFLGTVAANVDNPTISDAEFREFVRRTLPVVEGNPKPKRRAGIRATMWAARRIGMNYPHTIPSIFRDEQEGLAVKGRDEVVRITVEPAEERT